MSDGHSVILVVVDDVTVRELVAIVLAEKPDRTVTAVSNGAEALAFLAAVRPHLIVLDIMMPGIDGIAVYKHIREQDELNNVPVLLLAAGHRERTVSLGGWFEWMSKPFHIDELVYSAAAQLAEAERWSAHGCRRCVHKQHVAQQPCYLGRLFTLG
jgi:DNA-binding response OmpR family regulator